MRPFALAFIVAAPFAGCGAEPPPAPKPADLRGVVDTSLPRPQQEKQKVLKRVLDNLQAGTPYRSLKEYNVDVRLTETADGFLDGTLGLAAWSFNGKPARDDVPVALFLLEDKPENPQRRVERVYTVTGSPGKYVIARKR